ncbi:hypothetical protein BD289DRAFT_212228 [Coniella lustricola]|uniref:Stc1 domain-containing protein n=1 Tax=Coniella lustricola TaxID=2025994 RepID=A0A2T3ABJ4_9PEZI|nr:hypothetical protein BD289DRAFT_212228 [Coniella lustricola]
MTGNGNTRSGHFALRGYGQEMIRCKVDNKLEPHDQYSNNQLKNYIYHKAKGKMIELKCRKHTQGSVAEILCEECGKLSPPDGFSNISRKNIGNGRHRCRDCISWSEADMPGIAALPAPGAPRANNEFAFTRPEMIMELGPEDGDIEDDENHLDKHLFRAPTEDYISVTSSLCATETANASSVALDDMRYTTLEGRDEDNGDYYDYGNKEACDDNDAASAANSCDSVQAVKATNAARHIRKSHKSPSLASVEASGSFAKTSGSSFKASGSFVKIPARNMQNKTPVNSGRPSYTAYGPSGQVQQRTKTVSSVSVARSKTRSTDATTTVREISARGGFAKVRGRRTLPDPPSYLVWDHPDDRQNGNKKFFSDGESEDEF